MALPNRSSAIDVLRGLAVALVMCAHLPFARTGMDGSGGEGSFPPPWIAEVMAHGHYGVQLFLVISGYCIHTRWARAGNPEGRVSFVPFWRRRLTRLYPPYLVVVAASAALTFAAERFFPGAVAHVSLGQRLIDALLLLALLQNLSDAGARFGNPPLWSLALEEQLYLLYFPLLAIRRARGWGAALAVSLLGTVLWFVLGRLVPVSWHFGWYRAGPAYWIAWALGAVVAEVDCGAIRLPRGTESVWTFLVVLGCGALFPRPFRDLLVTVSFFFLLSWLTARERRGAPLPRLAVPLLQLGEISYGVYLTHNVVFVLSKRILLSLHIPDGLTLVLRAASGIVAGYLFWRVVERPFLIVSQRVKVPVR